MPGARAAQAAGADEFWVVEDLGWGGGISAAAAALAAVETMAVGIGVCPAPLRSPVLLAMEFALLARLHPGRFLPGIGHGVQDWMRSVGVAPRSPLALLEETVTTVKDLMAGRTVRLDGREVHVEGTTLIHPVDPVPPVVTGVLGPKSLELSGRVADGTLLVEGTGPDLVARAREAIDRGRAAAGRSDPHRILVFLGAHVTDDPAVADEVGGRAAQGFADFLHVPVEQAFVAVGPPGLVAERVAQLWDAGVDSVILRPLGPDLGGQSIRALEAVRAG